MLVELLNRLLELAGPKTVVEEGRTYISQKMIEVQAPQEESFAVSTLTGFVDGAKTLMARTNAAEEKPTYVLHVIGHDHVRLTTVEVDKWGRRDTYAVAGIEGCRFLFGTFMEPESFVIGLQTQFVPGKPDDLGRVLKLVSNLATENVATSLDDGVSQTIGLKQGVALKSAETIKPKVNLSPWRTFREVDQPSSDFLLRFRSRENQLPLVAIFEADGSAWKSTATQCVKSYLVSALPGVLVVA